MKPTTFWWRRSLRSNERALIITEYESFMNFLYFNGIEIDRIEIVHAPVHEGVKFDINVEGYVPWEEQIPILDFVKGDSYKYIITSQPGSGKAQPLSAKIKCPGGWIKMGDIKVGDVITSRDGSAQTVTGVYPQGVTEVWRVNFADGRYTDVNPDHLWEIRVRSNEGSQVLTTRNIKKLLDKNNDRSKRITVPLCLPEDGPDKDFKIDPYLLGVIIGDGSLTNRSVEISKYDQHIRDKIRELLPAELELRELKSSNGLSFSIVMSEYGKRVYGYNTLVKDLTDMGLMGRLSADKFIPEEYLHGSIRQRLALMQGLMDTDGTVDKMSSMSYSTVSPQLSEDVLYLARSLGCIAKVSTRIPKFTYKGEKKLGQKDHRIHIRSPIPKQMFSLPRKRLLARRNQYTDELRLRITSIEERPPEPTQCIMVSSSDHLYVTDDFVVTHNTLMALFLAEHIGERFVVITKGGYEGRWVPTLYETLGLEVDEVRSCCGEKALRRLIEEKKRTGIPEVKAIFFSIGGIRTYISNYEAGAYDGTELEDVPPEKLFEFLGIGFKIVDEAHMEIHAHYITDLYTNIKHSLYLTGTLIPKENDHFTAKVYETFLPPHLRKEASKLNVYAEAVEVFYELNEPNEAKYIGAQGGYNHIVLEEWILKNKARKDNWLQMLYDHLVEEWLTERVEETKAIIYCASVDMNEEVAKYMQRRLPDLKVVHFKAGDPYDYLIDNDLILATLGKAGTAVDIPMLEQVHMCHATDSPNTYIQAFGRLRELKKFPQIVVRYFWFTCKNIQKQVDYGLRRAKIIKPRVTKLKNKFLRKRI